MAVKDVMPEMVEGKNERDLLNMPIDQTLDLLDKVNDTAKYEKVLDHTVKGKGIEARKLGKILVPQSRHYSWDRAADILGIGSDNIITVPVDSSYRMNTKALDDIIAGLVKNNIPILAVISVLGTTEDGAVDNTAEIAAIRKKYAEMGVGFYYHIDAAYGGYARSMFIDTAGNFMGYEDARKTAREKYGIPETAEWPSRHIYEAYRSTPEADSITIDPHKLGYIPYPAGALVFKDVRILNVQSFHAAYVSDSLIDAPESIGHFTIEGSKPGAAAAAVWTAHSVCPLNMTGYGKLLGRTVKAANMLYESMSSAAPIRTGNGRIYRFVPLVRPDLNTVNYVIKEDGNPSLEAMNRLNKAIYDECSYVSGDMMKKDFIICKTEFSMSGYGDVPLNFVLKCGLDKKEWEKTGSVLVLRSCVMTPYLADEARFKEYFGKFTETLKNVIANIDK